jgi:Xaa-Pro aminopeptidase
MRSAAAAGADGLLVTHPADVRYLTGFTGSSGALALTSTRAALFTDGRYKMQAKQEAVSLRVVVEQKMAAALAVEWMAKAGVRRCGFDSGQTTVAMLDKLRGALPTGLKRGFFALLEAPIARQRELKDADEVQRMRRAAALGCRLFAGVMDHLRPGVMESRVAAELEFAARTAGAEAMSFETIVAGGPRSAMPHGKASQVKLPRRGFVTLDFGIVLEGYCSDMTRTLYLGKPSLRERDVYDSVLEAQQAAIATVRAGVRCEEVDEAARSVLRKAKLDAYFSHSTGHGVGIEIHEGPRLSTRQKQILEAGMVITIEPGVYLPGEYGVRIEDMVLVTKTGGEVLTAASPKQFQSVA